MSTTLHNKTPIIYSNALSTKFEKHIYFKMDCHQPTGSFKVRGVAQRCQEAAAEGSTHFVIASGGNAGLATAYAGWKLGIRTTVIVPITTHAAMRDKLEHLGATVKIYGDVWDETNAYAQSIVKAENATYIHPFDHPSVWAGNSTVIDECASQMASPPDAIVVAVGGGGYFCGVMEGLERNGWTNTKVVVAETDGTASLQASIRAKKLVTLEKIESIASSLGAKQVVQKALDWALSKNVQNYTVSDSDALEACRLFLNETGSLVEPACGAALASVYLNLKSIRDAQTVLVLVCGGAGVTFEKFNDYMMVGL